MTVPTPGLKSTKIKVISTAEDEILSPDHRFCGFVDQFDGISRNPKERDQRPLLHTGVNRTAKQSIETSTGTQESMVMQTTLARLTPGFQVAKN